MMHIITSLMLLAKALAYSRNGLRGKRTPHQIVVLEVDGVNHRKYTPGYTPVYTPIYQAPSDWATPPPFTNQPVTNNAHTVWNNNNGWNAAHTVWDNNNGWNAYANTPVSLDPFALTMNTTTTAPSDQGTAFEGSTSVDVQFTVTGISYNSLMANDAVKTEFETKTKTAVATAAGVTAAEVELTLTAGSVVIDASITPPAGTVLSVVAQAVQTGNVGTAVVNEIKTIPSVQFVTTSGNLNMLFASSPYVGPVTTTTVGFGFFGGGATTTPGPFEPTDFMYQGCFVFTGSLDAATSRSDMNLDMCFMECRKKGVRYFATTEGSKCFCATNPPMGGELPEKACNLPCVGSAEGGGEMCGGHYKRSSFYSMMDCQPETAEQVTARDTERDQKVLDSYAKLDGESCGHAAAGANAANVDGADSLTGTADDCMRACWNGVGNTECAGFTYDESLTQCHFLKEVMGGTVEKIATKHCYYKMLCKPF